MQLNSNNGDGYKGLIHQPNATEAPLGSAESYCSSTTLSCDYRDGTTTADEMLYPENLPLVDLDFLYGCWSSILVEDQQYRFKRVGADFNRI